VFLTEASLRADGTVFNLFNDFSSYKGNFASVGLDATGECAGLTFSDVGGVWTSTETTNGQRLILSTGTGDLVVVPEPSTYAMALAEKYGASHQIWARCQLLHFWWPAPFPIWHRFPFNCRLICLSARCA
jgi:hypothetical protein